MERSGNIVMDESQREEPRQQLDPSMLPRNSSRRGSTDVLPRIPTSEAQIAQRGKRENTPIETGKISVGEGIGKLTSVAVEALIPAGVTADWVHGYGKQAAGGRAAVTLAATLGAAAGYYSAMQHYEAGS